MLSIFFIIETISNAHSIRSLEGVFTVKVTVMFNSIFKSDFFFGLSSFPSSLQVTVDIFSSVFINLYFGGVDDVRDTSGSTVIIIATTRVARLFHGNVLILVNRDVVDNRLGNADWNFFLDGVRNNCSSDALGLRVLSVFVDGLEGGFFGGTLVEFDLHFFSVNRRLDDVLLVVNVTRDVNGLGSASLLVDSFFGQWGVVNDLVFFLQPFNIDVLSLLDGLDVRLGDVLVGWYVVGLGLDVVLDLSFSFNRAEGFSYSFSGLDLHVSQDFLDGGFNNVLVVNNISLDVNGLGSALGFVLYIHGDRVLVDDVVFLLVILRSDLFDGFVNGGLNNYSLSSWFDYLLSHNSRFADDSFSDDLWLGRNSLSDYFRFSSNPLLHNLCVLEHILHVHRVASSKGCVCLSLSRETLSHSKLLIK